MYSVNAYLGMLTMLCAQTKVKTYNVVFRSIVSRPADGVGLAPLAVLGTFAFLYMRNDERGKVGHFLLGSVLR